MFGERQTHHIFCYDQQRVSDIIHFVKGSLIRTFHMTNSLWVTLHILWKAVSSHLTNSLQVTLHILWKHSHHIFYDWQGVSDIAHFVKGSLIKSFPITNSLWVTLHILWKAVSLDLFYDQQIVSDSTSCERQSSHHLLWATACGWHCTFFERQSHQIFSYDYQYVSDIAHFVIGSLIRYFPMTNRLWVTLHILWRADSSHMIGSLWVTLHILWKAVLSDVFLWPTVCEQHCTCCGRQSH